MYYFVIFFNETSQCEIVYHQVEKIYVNYMLDVARNILPNGFETFHESRSATLSSFDTVQVE